MVMVANDTLMAAATGATYQWIDCGNGNVVVAGATNQFFIPQANGQYAVVITQNGCVDTSACYNVVLTSLNTVQENSTVHVYPNPFHEAATVSIEGEEFLEVQFELFDMTGRMIYQKTSTDSQFQINKSNLTQGIYVYRIVADGQLLNTGKLIAK